MTDVSDPKQPVWSHDKAASELDGLLDAVVAGAAQTIERDGARFVVTCERPPSGEDLRTFLLAGGPLDCDLDALP